MVIKSSKLFKKFLSLILVLFLCIENFAAVVSDNDGSAFITKAEFEALKNDFASQVEQYNTSIDSKIDGAISSYLAGISVNKKELLENCYEKLGCGKKWVWGNNAGTRTEYPYGGCDVLYWKSDTQSQKYGSITYNYNNYNNILFLGNGNTKVIGEQPYKYTIFVNERDWDHFYQNATQISGDRSKSTYGGWGNIYRDGMPKFNYTNGNATYPECHLEWGAIVESYAISTTLGVFSINNSSTEYFIDRSGDETGTIVTVEDYKGKGTESGDFTNRTNQTYKKKWRPSWTKLATHNQLRIEDWENYTSKQEKIISGCPVSFIEKNETKITVKYKTNNAGKLYIYDSVDPVPYSSLVDGKLAKIIPVTQINKELTLEINDCVKDSWLRAMFLPDGSNTAVLNIISVQAETT